MNDEKKSRFLRAFANLSYSEREEILKEFEQYMDMTFREKGLLNEKLLKSLGPISSFGCPFCGK